MIRKTLLKIKLKLSTSNYKDAELLKVITAFENLIEEIDFSSELIPLDNLDMLKKLFTSLKNEELNSKEIELLEKIKTTIENEQATKK